MATPRCWQAPSSLRRNPNGLNCTWLTAGVTSATVSSSSSWPTLKFETPIERA
jgi:hypothetical protein